MPNSLFLMWTKAENKIFKKYFKRFHGLKEKKRVGNDIILPTGHSSHHCPKSVSTDLGGARRSPIGSISLDNYRSFECEGKYT